MTFTRRKKQRGDSVREATMIALTRVIDPLLNLMMDAGVTVQELNSLIRDRAVRNAAERAANEGMRESKAQLAIVTGLPRSEVAKILRSRNQYPVGRRGQNPARRVLAAWYDNPQFLNSTGEPAILPIFGKSRSFERLVALNSGGIPVRAMLDELTKIGAVERLPGQHVKARSKIPILTGLNSIAIAALGERGKDLLETLTHNIRPTPQPLFEATAVVSDADENFASMIRREIIEQGTSFIDGIHSLLARSRTNRSIQKADVSAGCRLGVTVYYFQDDRKSDDIGRPTTGGGHRKNLRRDSQTTIRQTRRPAAAGGARKPHQA